MLQALVPTPRITLGSTVLPFGVATTSVSGLTLASPTFSGTVTGNGTIPNAVLANSAVTLGSTSISLGGASTTPTGLASLGITAPAANSTSLTLSGGSHTGSDATSDVSIAPTWNTTGSPTAFLLNVTNTASGASAKLLDLQVGGVTKFNVTPSGTALFNGSVTAVGGYQVGGTTSSFPFITNSGTSLYLEFGTGQGKVVSFASEIRLPASLPFGFSSGDGTSGIGLDTILTRQAAATFHLGAADAAPAVAQTLGVQGVVAGTSNTAGANWTLAGSKGTGTGAGGQLILQTAPAGATGTAQNALATGLTITAPAVNMQPSTVLGNQALATNATDGFLYIASGAGQPTGTPTTFTGRVPLYYDTTNHELWIYDGSWLQPKTPAGAATVTWQ